MVEDRAPLVSVLTPVHNGEEHLAACIDSVLAQSYDHWRYTIVDNCSSDRTAEIAAGYAAREPRIRVQRNAELLDIIANHGFTLRQADPASRYAKIVFADDWLYPDCLARMVELAEAHPSVGVVGAYGLSGPKVSWDGLPPDRAVVPGKAMCRWRLRGGPYVFGTLTSLLFRTDLLPGLRAFDDPDNLQADTDACFELLQRSDFGFVHQVLSFTRVEHETTNSAAARLRTTLAAHLDDLLKFGPACFEPDELERLLAAHVRNYHAFLADNALRFRGREFWRFHAERLRRAGHPLGRLRLAGLVGLKAADALFNPKRTVENLFRSVSAGAPRPGDAPPEER